MGMRSLERRLERMVEGVFSRRARNSIRPIELGRRLIREMDDQRSVDVKGRRIVPNDFEIHLSPHDHAAFADSDGPLLHRRSFEAEAPATADVETAGALPGRWADAAIVATYGTPDPLN